MIFSLTWISIKNFYYSIVIFLNKELKQYEERGRKGKECKISNLSVVIKLQVASGYYEGVVGLPEPDPLTSVVFPWPWWCWCSLSCLDVWGIKVL